MGSLVFLVGIFGGLYWWPVFIGFLALVACGLRHTQRLLAAALKAGKRPFDRFHVLIVTLLALTVLGPVFYSALYPPTAVDALAYHLPAARSYLRFHQVRPLPYLRFPVLPSLGEMLFAGAMLLFDDVTAQLVEFLFFALVLAALGSWAKRLGQPLAGLWSVGLLAGTPSFMYFGSTAYVDVGLAAFATLGFYALYCYGESGEGAWLTLAGSFGGCAAGTKHSGLLLLVVFSAIAVVKARRRRAGIRRLLPFVGAGVAFGSPWYLWNAYWTGNPVWPFLGHVFGYGFWTRTDVAMLDWSLQGYGWGRSLRSLLLLPWNLAFHKPVGEPAFQPALFVLLPVTVWWAFRRREGRGLLFAVVAYVAFWFYTSQQLRFLFPVLPILALQNSRALEQLTAGLRRSASVWVQRVAVGLVYVGFSYPPLGLSLLAARSAALPTTPSARDVFLQQWLPSYVIYRDLNNRYGRSYRIYALHDEAMKYYCDGTAIGDWFGVGRYGDVPHDSASKLHEFLRALNADFLLVRWDPATAGVASAAGSRQFFEAVPTDGDIKLFRVLAEPKYVTDGAP
jgi:4-amino-4-deoxy-L-arabinose transferase-like glycosyltransferase